MSRERAIDADTPVEELFSLADRWPDEVLENPVLAVLSLSDPRGWKQLVGRARWAKLASPLGDLARSLSASCERELADHGNEDNQVRTNSPSR